MAVEDKAEGSFLFDVFISFRGEDTRNGFTSHLHKELTNRGINTFIDNKDLEKGKRISYLFKHMEGSKIFVPVFSKNYAYSKWCLKEIAKMVEINNREGEKRPIIPIFYHVEPSDIKHCTESFGEAFQMHERDEELGGMQINEWKAALAEAGNFSGYSPSNANGNEANLITLIGQKVSETLGKVRFDIQPVGIDLCMHTLKEMLEREKDGVQMIGIWGLGGIGKTTLAMALYNKLSTTFERSCFLSDIRKKKSDLPSLQAQFMNEVLGVTMNIDHDREGVTLMKQRLGSKKVLLVLDDVDEIDQLEAFTAKQKTKEEWFGAGSKIIVTTRDKEVLLQHGLEDHDIYLPKELNKEHSLQLFCHRAFHSDQPSVEFKELSWKVVKVANGLPLALEVFGRCFYNLKEKKKWEQKLKKLERGQHKIVHEKLKISYNSLDHEEKSIFLDIACFFIGTMKNYPVYMWDACNYLSTGTLEVLQHRSLIKINKNDEFEMHDQIRDMGKKIMKEESNPDPLKYSRLWSKDQVLEVLDDAKLRRYVQIIDFTEVSDEQMRKRWKAIEAMPKLRMITGAKQNHLFRDEKEIIRLPSNIKWFGWKYCPCQTLTLHEEPHDQLLVLDLQYGDLQDLRSHIMEFPNLKVLDLSYCKNLIQAPDFTHLPSLEVLTLDYCYSLAELDELISNLKKQEKQVKLSTVGCDYVRN